jgi:hypothetical protein
MATRADIRAEARQLADQDASDFPTDAQYNIAINRGGNRVFLDLVAAGWPANTTGASVIATSVATVFPFGGTTLVLAVTNVVTTIGGQVMRLKRVNPGHAAALLSSQARGQVSEFYEVRMDINLGPVIQFYPPVAGTYDIQYISGFTGFTADGDVWRGPYGSDELLALYAARFGVNKEGRGEDSERLRKEYNDRLYEMSKFANRFDSANAPSITDIGPQAGPRNPFDYWAIGPQSWDF